MLTETSIVYNTSQGTLYTIRVKVPVQCWYGFLELTNKRTKKSFVWDRLDVFHIGYMVR